MNVIYRKRDIEDLGYVLRGLGCALETPDFEAGSDRDDVEFDFPPYFKNDAWASIASLTTALLSSQVRMIGSLGEEENYRSLSRSFFSNKQTSCFPESPLFPFEAIGD